LKVSERTARGEIVTGNVRVDGEVVQQLLADVTRFSCVEFDGETIQAAVERLHFMLNKPVGVVSATVDVEHPTVLDLIEHPDKATLHLAGRLDRSSTGLVLLTNDGRWSDSLMSPERKVAKVYLVETDRPIPESAVEQFAAGFFFETENLTTRPAELELLGERSARVKLREGRYHQIKRMFHRIEEIRLISLHRERIGEIALPENLDFGQSRALTKPEIASVSLQDSESA
ncbi:MAG: 16S rRNA pseudouridine516 synthase, partial [Verrucomicrobiales bacterium]